MGSKGSTYSVKRGSSDWTNIFNQYKSEIEKQLPGVTVTQDDVESITIVPYKLTNNNDGKHVDCRVVVKCKNLFTAKYFVNDPSKGDQGFIEVAGKITYRSGDTTKPADFNLNYPATKTVGGVEYTFSGWYTDEALTHKASFPYTMNGNVNFYAKYVAGYQVNYDLAGGAWSNSDSLMYKAEAGTSQVVRSEPTREGYDFTGWTVEGLTGTTTIASGQTFVMPANNVTLTANWKKKEAPLTVHYYWNGTTNQVKADKTTKAELDQTVTETPASVEGYTPVSTDAQSVTIKAEGNEITFYYYKNVELVANSDTATYDGTEKQVSGFTGAPEGADFGAISVGAKGTNAGTYAAEFPDGTKGQVDGTEKYIVSKAANGKLVITPVADEVVVTIKGHQGGEAYNGNTQKVTGYDVVSSSNPLYKAEDLSLKGEAKATGTNAGTYDMGLKSSDFENKSANFTNVTFKVEDGKLVISKREVTLTSASDSKVYDGKPLTNDEVTVGGAGFAKGEGVTFDVTGSQTVVGSSDNAFTYEAKEGTDLKANYTITKNEGTLEVTPRSIEADGMQVDGPSDVPYDGKAHRWSPTVTDGGKALVEGADYEVSYDKGDFTNVTGPIKVTVTGKGNYEGSVERTYQVTQRQVTVHTGSASKVYDGKPLAKDEAFVENLVEGETVTIHATGSQTEVGSSANGYQLAWDGSARESNYHVAS
ncbi:MAG: InlB B-repeat-containing protein, partial [Coriobacteriia bacterium]|nr:InlB B-repeat-containing protein [Coriobacteriia bacterium]